MSEETFDELLADLFDSSARDWPYKGERVATLFGLRAEVDDTFHNIYKDDGRRVDFGTERDYDLENLPVGYQAVPQVRLVLNMAVEDKSIPEPLFPPKLNLGDTSYVEVNGDGTQFRFLDQNGKPRNSRDDHTFAVFTSAVLSLLDPEARRKFATTFKGGDFWVNLEAFDGITAVWDAQKVGKATKPRAWPLRAVGAGEAEANEGASGGATLEELAAQATTAKEFLDLVVKGGFGDSALIARVVQEPEAVWLEYLT